MNKAELIEQLEGELGSKKYAAEALNAVVDTITRAVAKGEKVSITGFGTFERVTRKARMGRNPQTGETVRIAKANVPKFRAGALLKGYVANPSSLPKLTKTASPAKKATVKKKTTAKKATVKKTAAKKATAKRRK